MVKRDRNCTAGDRGDGTAGGVTRTAFWHGFGGRFFN